MATYRRTVRRVEVWMRVKDPKKLERARKNQRYTQAELARLARISQQYISVMENEKIRNRPDISEAIAERICRYLAVDLEDHFADVEPLVTPAVATRSRVARNAA